MNFNVVELVTLILFIQLLIGLVVVAKQELLPRRHTYSPILWLIHAVIVYGMSAFDVPNIELWMDGLSLHLAFAGGLLLWMRLHFIGIFRFV